MVLEYYNVLPRHFSQNANRMPFNYEWDAFHSVCLLVLQYHVRTLSEVYSRFVMSSQDESLHSSHGRSLLRHHVKKVRGETCRPVAYFL
jgi:hypothetical protein